jgi:hypothetical protein
MLPTGGLLHPRHRREAFPSISSTLRGFGISSQEGGGVRSHCIMVNIIAVDLVTCHASA